jgi:ribosomal protein S18 acetylase RimI-like enzyme
MGTAAAPNQELVIRPATPDDCEILHRAIVDLGAFVGASHKIESTPENLRTYGFGADPAFEALIAEVESEFAGMCVYFPSFSTWLGQPGVYVQDLFVAERFRGMKIGESLLRRVAALTRRKGGVYLRLSVEIGNATAQAFYDRLGIARSAAEVIHAAYGANFLLLDEVRAEGELLQEDRE